MTKRERAIQFFMEHGGFSYDPKHETPEQGRKRCAESMAVAEAMAWDQDYTFSWMYDEWGCSGCDCGDPDCDCYTEEPHEVLVCTMYDPNGESVASLGGICGATNEYRRVVQAELAMEAL